jgi:hypothetical protein
MSDTYQAIYDAVRGSLHHCNVESAIRDAIGNGLDASNAIESFRQELCIAANEMQRPSVLFRPSIGVDGNKWCALYGEDLAHGIAGFGDTPAEAMADFDRAWATQRAVRS